MSNRAAEYREMIGNLVTSGILDEEDRAELRDMLSRVERRILANMPATDHPAQHEAAE
jgi:uncharacterized protein YutE (UPF0331/DUF86 family)